MSTPELDRLRTALAERYEIERELGAGGMATVYLARDLKHDRQVAIKVLMPELAAMIGADRFLREITVTANLQHPHILPLHDSGDADGHLYYLMPYVEGESLRQRLDREKQLPVDEALRITTETAEALEYAHGREVIHRDIKPENLLLHEGRVLVADFGIALAVQQAGGTRLTETGLSVGTPAYMSPEQASGDRELDGRSDIYSLGCVAYEMLSGEPPHSGPTAQAVLMKIVADEPRRLRELRPTAPAHVEAVIHTAIQKLPADRYRDASAFIRALGEPGAVSVAGGRERAGWKLALGALGMAAVAVLAFVTGRSTAEGDGATSLTPQSRQITFAGNAQNPALSPDGGRLAFSSAVCEEGRCGVRIVVQDLSGGAPVVLADLSGSPTNVEGEFVRSLEWDRTGERLLYALGAPNWEYAGIYSIPWLGGSPTKLASEVAQSVISRPGDGRIDWIAFPEGFEDRPIWKTLDPESGEITARELPIVATHAQWSPDGQWLALIGGAFTAPSSSRPLIAILSAEGELRDSVRAPFGDRSFPAIRWNGSGEAVLFLAGGALMRLPVDPASGTFDAAPQPVVRGLQPYQFFASGFDMAPGPSRFVYQRSQVTSVLRAIEDTGDRLRSGTLKAGTAWVEFPAISPDGSSIAYIREDHLGPNVYVQPFDGGGARALTASADRKKYLAWSPSGRHLGYLTQEAAGDWLTVQPVDGSLPKRVGVVAAHIAFPRWAWFSAEDSLALFQAGGRVAIAGVDGIVRELPALPDSIGHFWNFAVSASGDSVAAISHQLRQEVGYPRTVLHVASMDEVEEVSWKPMLSMPWGDLLAPPIEQEGSPAWGDWRHISVLGWRDGDLIIGHSARRGSGAHAGLWAIPVEGGDPRELIGLTDSCGAPTFIAMSADGSRMVCVHREVSRDIWLVEEVRLDP